MKAFLAAALTATVLSLGFVATAHAENRSDGSSSTTANDTLMPFTDQNDNAGPYIPH